MQYDLSVIIVNYNTSGLTSKCILSIIKYSREINLEIIVIDNASSDGFYEKISLIKDKIKSLKILRNKHNIGFGKANNQGIKIARGKYVLFLNSDTNISDNLLSEMLYWMDRNLKVGMSTCALKNPDGTLQGTGGFFPTIIRVFSWMTFLDDIPLMERLIKPFHPFHARSFFYKGESYYNKTIEFDWITGAFMLVRYEAIKQVDGFDEDYFMYTEDTDLCYRIKQRGWKIMYIPKWSITHYGGKSSRREFSLINEYHGIKIFYKKHMPSYQMALLRIFLKLGAVLRMVVLTIIEGKEAFRIYAKAFQIA